MQLGFETLQIKRTQEEQEISREKRRVSMARLCTSQSQELSVRYTDALGRM